MNKIYQFHDKASEIRDVDLFVSKRISRIREMKGVSSELMASQLDISTGLLGEYEAGTGRIPAVLLCRMSQFLCVRLSHVFSDKPLDSIPTLETD